MRRYAFVLDDAESYRSKSKLPQRRVLVFCETNTSYGRGVLEGLSQYAAEKNWILSFEQRGRDARSFERYKPWRADGIVVRSYYRSFYNKLQNVGLPLVELLGYADSNAFPAVTMDERRVAELVVDHFLERGLRRFAYYCMEDAPIFYARRDFFLQRLERWGIRATSILQNGAFATTRFRDGTKSIVRNWRNGFKRSRNRSRFSLRSINAVKSS